MFEVFEEYLLNQITLRAQELSIIQKVSVVKKLRKNQYLLQEGDVWRNYAFVCKGCLRTYTVDDKSYEHIISFAIEKWWAGDKESFRNESASRFNIDAIEDSVVLLISKQNLDGLLKTIPQFHELMRLLVERGYAASQFRISIMMSYTAKEKYKYFVEKYPQIAKRVPQHMLASYLGITPETLSRVRRSIGKG